ncbi:hypothetical protein [Streptomyces sp. CAI-85]|uniref:hypothetical protein n=1 Tax=Streptomyces sp. CAI-85 TaxID=1472662 RepID=UPI0015875258|nr:hypothetical protein [Streptomyces sp. CAI-85]NUV60656.1 hypothetical protein [Streptomyces sp. CAI-85]
MARIQTDNGDTFEIAETRAHDDGTGIQLVITTSEFGIDTNTAHLLTPSEARRIATALTTMANTIDANESVRPEVVTLLAGLDAHGSPDQWTHSNGRPLTDAERDTALSATAAELEAAAVRLRDDNR